MSRASRVGPGLKVRLKRVVTARDAPVFSACRVEKVDVDVYVAFVEDDRANGGRLVEGELVQPADKNDERPSGATRQNSGEI